jgi:hypothetical protein
MQMNLLFRRFIPLHHRLDFGLDENMYVTQVQQNPFENEIIINVPVAIGIMNSDSYGLWKLERAYKWRFISI